MERLFEKPPCGRCQTLKGDKFDPADCIKCVPTAFDENEDALMIYPIVADQYIVGMSGVIAINHEAVHRAMDLYEIEDKRTCFEKVLKLSRYFIAKSRGD